MQREDFYSQVRDLRNSLWIPEELHPDLVIREHEDYLEFTYFTVELDWKTSTPTLRVFLPNLCATYGGEFSDLDDALVAISNVTFHAVDNHKEELRFQFEEQEEEWLSRQPVREDDEVPLDDLEEYDRDRSLGSRPEFGEIVEEPFNEEIAPWFASYLSTWQPTDRRYWLSFLKTLDPYRTRLEWRFEKRMAGQGNHPKAPEVLSELSKEEVEKREQEERIAGLAEFIEAEEEEFLNP